jgi:Na+-transporting NADH:ubiquinone oxidoreductase subunit F
VRTLKDLYLVDKMSAFEKELAEFRFVPVVSEPQAEDWQGERGRVTEVAKKYLEEQPDAGNYEGYLCGSPGMIDSAIAVLTSLGIPLDKIYYDKFS